jgi:hypothetical protein
MSKLKGLSKRLRDIGTLTHVSEIFLRKVRAMDVLKLLKLELIKYISCNYDATQGVVETKFEKHFLLQGYYLPHNAICNI